MDRIPRLRGVMTRSWVFSTPPKKLNIRGNYVCAMWTFLLKLWDKRAYFWEVWHPKKNDRLESRSLEEFRHSLSQNTNIQLAFFWIIFRQWMTKGASRHVADVPKGAQMLRTEAKAGKYLWVFGIYRSMEAFVHISRQLVHPFDELKHFPDSLIICIFDTLTTGLLGITKRRIATLNKWMGWASELAKQEKKLREGMDAHVTKVLSGKRLLLLQKKCR